MLPVSAVLEGEYGLDGLCLSVPAIVGETAWRPCLEIPLAARSGRRSSPLHSSSKRSLPPWICPDSFYENAGEKSFSPAFRL